MIKYLPASIVILSMLSVCCWAIVTTPANPNKTFRKLCLTTPIVKWIYLQIWRRNVKEGDIVSVKIGKYSSIDATVFTRVGPWLSIKLDANSFYHAYRLNSVFPTNTI